MCGLITSKELARALAEAVLKALKDCPDESMRSAVEKAHYVSAMHWIWGYGELRNILQEYLENAIFSELESLKQAEKGSGMSGI